MGAKVEELYVLTGAVEGSIDEVALRRVCQETDRAIEHVYVTNGKANLLKRLAGFNHAAQYAPWVVLLDLNGVACAPELQSGVLPAPAPQMCFRVAVRAIESWILGDRERLARFMSVPLARVPVLPDDELDPKQTMVNLARHSRRRAIRADMVPSQRSGQRVGPGYAARLIEFLLDQEEGWRPSVAAIQSDSLSRCLRALAAV